MKLLELIQHAQTKAGEVRLDYEQDVEPENRGFVVDMITAYLNDRKIGYLKMMYVPKEKFHQFFPSVLHYESVMSGRSYIPYRVTRDESLRFQHWMEYSEEIKREMLENILVSLRWHEQKKARTLPIEKVEAWIRKFERQMADKKKGFKEFYSHTVNKPIVDFIHVDSGEWVDDNKFGKSDERESMRRKGIGSLLYKAGAEWMKERGMRLYASGIQSSEAQAVWRKLIDQGKVGIGKRGRRYYRESHFNKMEI